jgi:conjugal transfer pilus assembly protein TraW
MSQSVGFLKIASLAALFACCEAPAKDLGVIGTAYPVIERDLIEVIQERLRQKTQSGELAALNQAMLDRAKRTARRPPGVALPRAKDYRAVALNPVYTLDKDLTDAEGKLLFKAGTPVNPLEIRPLSKTLCFIDGDDPQQVAWIKTYCANEARNKWILINGDTGALSQQTGVRWYFDQRGVLTQRFGLQAVPAVIRQSGRRLYVEEFPVE